MRSLRWTSWLGVFLLVGCSESPVHPPDGPVGILRVTATTTGPGATPTLLQLLVDDDPPVLISANGTQEFEGVTVGELVARVVIPGHCSADHYAPRTVEIEEDVVTELTWAVRCPLPTAPGISTNRWDGTESVAWIANADGSGGGPIGGTPPLASRRAVLNPARTRLAYQNPSSGTLTFVDVDRGRTVVSDVEGIVSIDWSPDGQRLLVALAGTSGISGGALLLVWADGVVERMLRPSSVTSARWAPDGRRVAYCEGAYIFVEDLQSGTRLNTGNILAGGGGEPAWSPSGTELAFLDAHAQSILVMDADGANLRTVAPYTNPVAWSGLDWGANGMLLMTKNIPPSNWGTLHVVPSSGGNLVPLLSDGADHQVARWAP